MRNLFIIPAKTLSQTTLTEWRKVISKNDVLFTCYSNEYGVDDNFLKDLFCKVYTFTNFNNSGLIEKLAKELHQDSPFSKIISTSEIDVLRSARLREDLNIEGVFTRDAILFRDKFQMKHHLKSFKVKVPEFEKITSPIELINFSKKVGCNFIVKPNLGAGSTGTHIVKSTDQFNSLLMSGAIDCAYDVPDLIAERFVEGKMYHVDGLVINNQIIVNQPSSYLNTCVEFQNGTHIGSYMLSDLNPISIRLKELNSQILSLMPSLNNFAFHAEYFHDENDELIFCEIACRPGGGVIKDVIFSRYGINIVTEWMKAEINNEYRIDIKSTLPNISSGFLLIPPTNGILQYIPNEIPFEWVKQYKVMASMQSEFKGKAKTSGEIVSMLIIGSDEEEVQNRINVVASWMNKQIKWA